MIRNCMALLALGCSLLMATACTAPAAHVTYIANEGFLIEAGGRKILVDALFHDETIDWCHVPEAAALAQMEKAEGPFQGVDLILITHSHVDHFTSAVVLRHLSSNPDGVVVGPPQAIAWLRAEETWRDSYEDRIREVDIDLHRSVELTVRGIRVQAHRIRHGAYMETDPSTGETRNRHESVENLAYLVEAGGMTFIHLGDAFLRENGDYFESGRFPKQRVDIVFLEGWSDETLSIMREWMDPGRVVFMHLPADPEQLEGLSGYLASRVDNAVIFKERMESRSFRRNEASRADQST